MDRRKLKVLGTKLRRELRARGTAVWDRLIFGSGLPIDVPEDTKQPLPYLLYVCEMLPARAGRTASTIELLPENPDYPVIVVQPGEVFEIEGLAVGLIRNTMLM